MLYRTQAISTTNSRRKHAARVFFLFLLCMYVCMYLLIYLWLHWLFVAARGLSSSCGERGLLLVVVCGLLIAVASLVAEHGL